MCTTVLYYYFRFRPFHRLLPRALRYIIHMYKHFEWLFFWFTKERNTIWQDFLSTFYLTDSIIFLSTLSLVNSSLYPFILSLNIFLWVEIFYIRTIKSVKIVSILCQSSVSDSIDGREFGANQKDGNGWVSERKRERETEGE